MPEWSFIHEKVYALLRGYARNRETASHWPGRQCATLWTRQNEGKGTSSTAARNARAHVPRNLKSLYGGHKPITCLTSPAMAGPCRTFYLRKIVPISFFQRPFRRFPFLGSGTVDSLCFTYRYGVHRSHAPAWFYWQVTRSRNDRFSVAIERF